MIIYMSGDQVEKDIELVLEILANEYFLENRILDTAIIAVKGGNGYQIVYPKDSHAHVAFEG